MTLADAVFAAHPDPMLVTDALGQLLAANDAALTALGYDRATLPALRLTDLWQPGATDGQSAAFRDAQGRMRTFGVVTRPLATEGAGAMLIVLRPLASADAAPPPLSVPDTVLQAKAGQLAAPLALLETISDAFFQVDLDYNFVYLNAQAERLLERDRDALIGRNMWAEFPGAAETVVGELYPRSLATGESLRTEVYFPPLKRWLALTTHPGPAGLAVYFHDVTADRVQRDRLRLLEAAVTRMNDILLITEAEPISSPGPRIVYVNEAFTRRTGLSWDEVIGQTPRILQGPQTQRAELDRIRSALAAWQPVRAQLINYTKGGEEFWLELDIVPIADETGWYTHWVAIERDITERKRAEERLKMVIEAARVGVWEWSVLNEDLETNDHWGAILGYTGDDLPNFHNSTWRSLLHPDDLPAVDVKLAALDTPGHDTFEAEYRMRHKDGPWIWLMDRGRVLRRGADGKPEFLAGVQMDISEQKSREMALREAQAERDAAERRFKDVVAVSENVFWELDADLRFSFLSRDFARDSPPAPGNPVIGLALTDWLAGLPAARASADWQDVLRRMAERLPFRDVVFRAPPLADAGADGPSERWLRVMGAPFFAADGAFLGYRGVTSDVTQLVMARATAEAANQTKSIFLANMSHELRTPLNGVLGMAEVLDMALTDPDHQRMMRVIRESGALLLNILNDILDMSKIEAGKLELEQLPFRPVDVARRVEDLHALRAQEKGLDFEVLTGLGADQPRLGDPHRIQMILQNLLGNAIKFTNEGEVSCRIGGRPGKPLVIEVKDSGIGMTAEQAATVYDEFMQGDPSITRRYGGTGLGLTITRRLVTLMGGDMTIASEPGVGTTVTVSLPLPACEPDTVPAEAPAPVHRLAGLRVLAADDNLTNGKVLEQMLKRQGADVTVVTDGQQALEAWAAGRFDILLLDIAMPVMDGVTAVKWIRTVEAGAATPRTPVVAVTANAMLHQVAEYLEAGFDAHIGKPLRTADLARIVAEVMTDRAT
jgi:PAS domain S-box-containing protein